MDYLVYVERNAENLQFYLWLKDYTARFNALKQEEQALSPAWSAEEPPGPEGLPIRGSKQTSVYEREVDFDGARPGTRNGDKKHAANVSVSDAASFLTGSTHAVPFSFKNIESISEDANTNVGLKWKACRWLPCCSSAFKH